MDLLTLKKDIFDLYKKDVFPSVLTIKNGSQTHQDKAKAVNKLIQEYSQTLKLKASTTNSSIHEKQQTLIVLQYCFSVVSLDYRNEVWPYEYMALSRRVGELWEKFCSAAWESPSREQVGRIDAPSFIDVSKALKNRIIENIQNPETLTLINDDIETLFELIGEINMKEDEVFKVIDTPYVIDFKSGFGSNEKGNTLRLLTVGKAYKIWDRRTKLIFLVRQKENNNYLNVIRRSNLWEVFCGDDAYAKIDELTGSNMTYIRENIIKFKADLSTACTSHLASGLSDLSSYLDW